LKGLSKLKLKNDEPLAIEVFEKTATFNGFEVSLFDGNFPQYEVVIPNYTQAMEFDREQLIKNVKKVMPYANKSTSQVTFHLNGCISMRSEDIDFGFECDAEMPYISKEFPDTDIAFNGKFLNECLGSFKDKTVKMYSDGISTKAALFTNDKDTLLLMPLMINS
jgi:DNA polymerase-3 subunit beta